MKKTIALADQAGWNGYISRAHSHDFYHTQDYHCLEASGESLLFVFEENAIFIAIPVVKRKIPGTDRFDLSSVYGYTGPVCNLPFAELSGDFIHRFRLAFMQFFEEERVVSVFLRLHPFFDQLNLFEPLGGLFDNGQVVAIDLQLPLEAQRSQYQTQVKSKIKQLQKRGFTVKEARGPEAISTFHQIYTENMVRVNAASHYLFSKAYFFALLNSTQFTAKLLFVYNEAGDSVCGTVITFASGIMQAHLIGTANAYLADSPAKLMVDEASILGRQLGMKYYNLGGGFGFREDNLFGWKASFSHTRFPYTTWRFIADRQQYAAAVAKKMSGTDETVDFFPLYRYSEPLLAEN
ncbi:GNAT family N-acetyltransferase [Pedobacter yulinensis]|uniref:GNAT family N-acetyltransferase n=1 Tax=Pedobacter yulinensis TaxID=2126353 RepID=A0A2T3HLD8_9SPHI|nr:GNAT family N-acetyltransferase [Pedobacter yulinensis]PST83244.1 GNAT family N-acetyltransferase [Pedobacter yulinensis]